MKSWLDNLTSQADSHSSQWYSEGWLWIGGGLFILAVIAIIILGL